ncbi:hypothetical protein AVEN_62166-1 [Araneus ventricosus]|uniref:Uncharacterized protein n=1 Tax=Araneus ventricosus TaxID=182803 RepID=A0A4Y2AG18_ARAVE|nr:hypothetical protein AVEN_62166-1 [Araneus ventricosus]
MHHSACRFLDVLSALAPLHAHRLSRSVSDWGYAQFLPFPLVLGPDLLVGSAIDARPSTYLEFGPPFSLGTMPLRHYGFACTIYPILELPEQGSPRRVTRLFSGCLFRLDKRSSFRTVK